MEGTQSDGDGLFDLYRSVDMEVAMSMEEEFSDSDLGLVAQSADRNKFPIYQ